MLNYSEYRTFGGKLSEEEFTSLLPRVYDFIQSFVEQFVATSKMKSILEEYGDFNKALTYQIDFISDVGGESSLNGMSDIDAKEIRTDNFKYTVEHTVEKYNGIPVSPLTQGLIMKELRINNYLSRCVND